MADLQYAVGQKLGGVGVVVDGIVERGVDVGDMEAFEIVVDVEGPVGADGCIRDGAPDRVGIGRWGGSGGDRSSAGGFVRAGRRDLARRRGSGTIGRGEFGEAVGCSGEVDDVFEFGHGEELAVEVETAAVVAASQIFLGARAFADEIAAVGADVGEAVDLIVVVAGEEEGFVDCAVEKRAGMDVAGSFDDLGVGEELPGGGEGFLF